MKRMNYFRCGADHAEREFEDDAAAVAFAHRMAREMAFWDFQPGTILQVCDNGGDVIAEIAVKRPLH